MRELHLLRAAKRRLQHNVALDTAPADPRVAFRLREEGEKGKENGAFTEYYVPGMFHMAWTMDPGTFVDARHCDLVQTKPVCELYVGHVEKSVRMLRNWPLRNIRIVGCVVSTLKRENDYWEIILDDGSYGGAAGVKVGVGSYAWTVMEVDAGVFGLKEGTRVQVQGEIRVPYEEETLYIRASSLKVVDASKEIEWWASVLTTQERLKVPWLVDMSSQDALNALRSLEMKEPEPSNVQLRNDVAILAEVIEIEDDDNISEHTMHVQTRHGTKPFSTLDDPFSQSLADITIATPQKLQGAVVTEIVRLALANIITVSSDELLDTPVKRVAEGIVLGAIAREWYHGREIKWNSPQWEASRKSLVETVLDRLARCGAVHPLGNSVDIVPMRGWAKVVIALFTSVYRGKVSVQEVRSVLWKDSTHAEAVHLVAALISAAKVSHAWVWDTLNDVWLFQEGM